MGQVVQLPDRSSEATVHYGERLKTAGNPWTRKEKKLLDKIEFLEAMVLVLDDVRLKNIRENDHGMMEVVQEEIPRYIERIEEIRRDLESLRAKYGRSLLSVARG
ncbi:MAG: hypothetical protein ABIH23_03515 [bacterium]